VRTDDAAGALRDRVQHRFQRGRTGHCHGDFRQLLKLLRPAPQPRLRLMLGGTIPEDLEVAAFRRFQAHDEAGSPETRAVPPSVPAFVDGPPVAPGPVHLMIRGGCVAVFGREDDVPRPTDRLRFRKSGDPLGAAVPARDGAMLVEADDREVLRALDDLPVTRSLSRSAFSARARSTASQVRSATASISSTSASFQARGTL
jgi:hypothetical protein